MDINSKPIHPWYQCLTCKILFRAKGVYIDHKYCSRNCYAKRTITPEWIEKISKAKKGKSPWNKGIKMWADRPHPKGTLGMIGLNKGKPVSEETRKKQREAHLGKSLPDRSGDKHHNWKGGITPENIRIRASAEYNRWRTNVYERDKYICQACGKKGGYLHADHILPFCLYPERRFDINNGRTLCVACHRNTDSYGGKMHKNSKFKKNGEFVNPDTYLEKNK